MYRPTIGCDDRRLEQIAKSSGIAIGYFLSTFHLTIEHLEFDEQDRGLKGVETAGQADSNVFVPLVAITMSTHRPHSVGEFLVIAEDRSSIAVTTERLGRVEGRRGRHTLGQIAQRGEI